ncbi:MAG TPA: alpha/beta hydrolase, partial [Novosphingobium sp.]
TRVRHGGSGPPLLLLHGCPQTHMMWGQIADQLALDFTVIAPDIRGYGECSAPAAAERIEAYSKRAMAKDAVALMEQFGFPTFYVAGHDRGGRIAYRLAMDHPERVSRLSVLDIVPTGDVWARADGRLMQAYWHWAFLALPAPQPEDMIRGVGAETFLLKTLLGGLHEKPFVESNAYADYARCAARSETIRGICQDYRAGAGVDRELDEAQRGKVKLGCPVQVLWGAHGTVGRLYKPLEVWSAWTTDLCGEAIDSGHFLAEENPAETLAALRRFFLGRN